MAVIEYQDSQPLSFQEPPSLQEVTGELGWCRAPSTFIYLDTLGAPNLVRSRLGLVWLERGTVVGHRIFRHPADILRSPVQIWEPGP